MDQERLANMKHEVDSLRTEITNNFSYMKEKLDAILAQTIKTNGRVTALETWQQQILGGGAVLKFVWAFVGVYIFAATGALLIMWSDYRNLHTSITEVVRYELQQVSLQETKN